MAVDTSRRFKNPAAFTDCITQLRWLAFFLDPPVELILRFDVHAQEHFGVLGAAILGTLTKEDPNFMRIDPSVVSSVRNQVSFPSQAWDPEAVIRVCGKQSDKSRPGMGRIADRDVQLVCRDYSK